MKTLKFFAAPFLLLVFLSLFTTACQKTELVETQADRADRNRGEVELCNDHEYYGELHNQALEFILASEDEIAAMPAEEVEAFLISQTETFLASVELEGTGYNSDEGLEWSLLTDIEITDFGHMIASSVLTDYEKSRATDLVNEVLASAEENGGLDAVLSIVSAFECEIENDEEVTNIKELQAMSSIARNSANLWYDHTGGGNSNETYRLEDVILADAMGAMHGSVLGPWGMLGFGALGSALSYAHSEGYI